MVRSMPTAALAALLAASPVLAAAPAAPQDTPAQVEAEPPHDATSTAVPLRPIDQRMSVDVMINGAGPFRFIVDSGATRTVVSRRLAILLGLPSVGIATLHSVGGESQVDTVKIGALVLNGLPPQPIVAPVLEEDDLGAAGILGIDALADKKVVIDLVANRMTVEAAGRPHSSAGSDEIVVTARRRFGQLVLADADAAGQRIYAVVDTGSSVTLGNLVLRDKLVRRKRLEARTIDIVDVAGHTIQGHYGRINDIRLGPTHIQETTIVFSDAHAFVRFGLGDKPAMLLGMDLLRGFKRVSIDFKNRTVTLVTATQVIG
ncbi:MAG TPA: aspartyl protease family protein [Sphingomonas sp.]|nr:aspartyl protease family protein [Sphingomonas sp.]